MLRLINLSINISTNKMNTSGQSLCRKEAIRGDSRCLLSSTGPISEIKCHYEVAKTYNNCLRNASKIDTNSQQFASAIGVAAGDNHSNYRDKRDNLNSRNDTGKTNSINYSNFSNRDYLVADIDTYIASMPK